MSKLGKRGKDRNARARTQEVVVAVERFRQAYEDRYRKAHSDPNYDAGDASTGSRVFPDAK